MELYRVMAVIVGHGAPTETSQLKIVIYSKDTDPNHSLCCMLNGGLVGIGQWKP